MPKVLSETGNCNSAGPSGPPPPRSSLPVTPAPGLLPRSWFIAGARGRLHTPGQTSAPAPPCQAEERPGSGAARQTGEYRSPAPSRTVRLLLPLPRWESPALAPFRPLLVSPTLKPQEVCQTSAAYLVGNSKRPDLLGVQVAGVSWSSGLLWGWPSFELSPVVGEMFTELGFPLGSHWLLSQNRLWEWWLPHPLASNP